MTLARLRAVDTAPDWSESDSRRLEEGLRRLALKVAPAQMIQLQDYGALLLKWNRTYNLLGATSAPALTDDHLLDSLAIVEPLNRWLGQGSISLLDIGSGAGLPGFVLAIMLERLKVTLVEPNGKKAAFLRQAAAHCRLPTVEVSESRIEDIRLPSQAPQASSASLPGPHFICRAFTSLSRYATLCRPLMNDGSLVFAMKALRVREELAELEGWVEVLAVEQVPAAGKELERNLVVMRAKTSSTQSFNTAGPQGGSASGGSLGNHPDDR